MNIRTFCAPSVEAALAQVRRDLGQEAVILSSRDVPFAPAHACFEVVAARESAPAHSRRNGGAAPWTAGFAPARPPAVAARAGGANASVSEPGPPRGDQGTRLLEQQLVRQEVDPRLARELARRLSGGGQGGATPALAGLLTANELVDPDPRPEGLTVLLGGTGVGKTTTLAKLAARLSAEGRRPALLTCDTWRVAAVEQLSVFAGLIGVPLAVAYTPAELAEAAAGFAADGRCVLVDTPGRAPRDAAGLTQLKGYLDALPARQTHLVVPAYLRGRDIESLVAAWRPFGFDRLLLTKLDETTTCGSLLTLLVRARRPASWITFGQNVPDDLSPARASELATFILDGTGELDAEATRRTA